MDLPTCPSCGQSVLDDEPVSCPFCGAAMDGSSGPTAPPKAPPRPKKKKPAATAPKKKPAKSRPAPAAKPAAKPADNDTDPFGIAISPQARRAIACSPRRTKSRPMQVTCPMCDTKGYIPPSAAGKQVKCANADCMVPLFTAPDPNRPKTGTTPDRRSDQAAQQEERLTRPGSKRSPMVMYGVLGAVLLLAGVGFKFYLDQSPDEEQFRRPFEIAILPVNEDGDNSDGSGQGSTDAAADVDGREVVERLVERMIMAAQTSVNRDKALCRRLTADAFLRINDMDRAATELDQLLTVSHQRNRQDDYYRMAPRSRSYWEAVLRGDQATADLLYSHMQEDAETIPSSGLLAVDAAISWGAVLVHRDRAADAQQLANQLDVDESVRTRTDSLHRGAWTSISMTDASHGRHTDSPIAAMVLRDPVSMAIARQLTLHDQWNAALTWAHSWTDDAIRNELMAEIARQAVRTGASESIISSIEESAAAESTQHRVQAVFTQLSDERWQAATGILPDSATAEPHEMPSMSAMMRLRRPDLESAHEDACLLTELARSAAARKQAEATAEMILNLLNCLMQQVPPTSEVRTASVALDRSENDVRRQLQQELGRSSPDDVSSEFRSYRRGLDRLAAVAEQRRILLIRLLCGIVATDAGAGLNQALDQSELLTDELTVDPLCQLIAGEAILAGGRIAVLESADEVRIPRGQRTEPQLEDEVAPAWFGTLSSIVMNHDSTILASLQSTSDLPGLRSCLQWRIVEALAARADVPILDAIATVKDEISRETSLWAAALWLVRAGKLAETEEWSNNSRLSATDRIMTMSGIINGLDLTEPAEEEEVAP